MATLRFNSDLKLRAKYQNCMYQLLWEHARAAAGDSYAVDADGKIPGSGHSCIYP